MVHSYSLGGYNLALDVHSGAVHLLDTLGMKMLPLVALPMPKECPKEVQQALEKSATPEEIAECWGELYSLYESEQLFSSDDYQQFIDRFTPSPIKAICLHVAHGCNLRCRYCFAGDGQYGDQAAALMSEEVGKKAIDYLLAHSESRKNLEVDFFGGEPLLNLPMVEKTVAYARSKELEYGKRFRFTITTNGMLLDEHTIEFINREMHNVVLSVDGRESVNDHMRQTPSGGGSYQKILPKFQQLVKARGDGQYYVRGTFTAHNMDFSEDVYSLYNAGFDQISVEPVVSPESCDWALTEAHLPALFLEYERLAQRMIESRKKGERFNFFHYMMDLSQGPCAIKRLRGCGSGNEYVAVTPEGEVYPCHQFVGNHDFLMGSVLDGSLNTAIKEEFSGLTVYTKETCRNCWAKFYCSGGCNANNLNYGGSLQTPHKLSCELEKKRVECAIMLKADALSSQ